MSSVGRVGRGWKSLSAGEMRAVGGTEARNAFNLLSRAVRERQGARDAGQPPGQSGEDGRPWPALAQGHVLCRLV